VLESLDDYLKYKIVPPKDMQKEYFEALEKQRVTKLESLNNQVEKVLGKFNEFKTYWSKKHKTKKELIEEKKNNKNKKELEDLRNTKTRKEIVLRVKSKKQVIDIGEFVVK